MNPARPEDRAASARRTAAGESAVRWAIDGGDAGRVLAGVDAAVRSRSRRRRAGWVAATGVAAGLVVAAWWPAGAPAPAASARPAVIVSAPERRTLPDGSTVLLREGARIEVDFDGAGRRVVLQRGEAHFAVVREIARPFTVAAGGVVARAVGTEFSVQLDADGVEVLVNEGRVAVEGSGPAVGPARLVEAGKRARVTSAAAPPEVEALAPQELDARLAWRARRVDFSSAPLAEVAPLFHRAGGPRLVLADPAVGALRISGVLRSDNIESLVRLLELQFGVIASRPGDAEIVLRSAP